MPTVLQIRMAIGYTFGGGNIVKQEHSEVR